MKDEKKVVSLDTARQKRINEKQTEKKKEQQRLLQRVLNKAKNFK